MVNSQDQSALLDERARLLLDTDRYAEAFDEIARAIRDRPRDIDLRLTAADVCERVGALPEAADHLASALASNPEHPEANRKLAELLVELGDTRGAIRCWQRLVAGAGEEDSEATVLLAIALSNEGQHEAAIELFEALTGRYPLDPGAQANLGTALLSAGREEKALLAFTRALALDPQSAQAQCGLGLIHHQRGRMEEAAAAFREVERLAPESAVGSFNLGLALERLGDREGARRALLRAAAVEPQDDEIQRVLEPLLSRRSLPPALPGGPDESAAIRGELESFDLFNVLEFLRMQEKTGALVVSAPAGVGILRLEQGMLIGGSAPRLERLGEVLLRRGLISPEHLASARSRQAELYPAAREGRDRETITLGAVLLKEQLVEEKQLTDVLYRMLLHVVRQINQWREGKFSFHSSEDTGFPIRFNVQQVVLDLMRLEDETQHLLSGGNVIGSVTVGLACVSLLAPAPALAQASSPNPNAPSLPGSPAVEPAEPASEGGPPSLAGGDGSSSLPPEEQRWMLVEQELQELRERVQRAEDERARDVSPLTVHGYVDIGLFAPLGNDGVGWVRDVANRQFPRYSNYGWTFLGDILGSPINSRGEAADLGEAPGADRFDSVDSDGAPGFIVNELNLRLGYTLSDQAILRASVNFLPRAANRDYELGDFLEVDLAELEYVLTEDGRTSLFVGKILPVFGIEYKDRKSDERFGITPSLIARYTTGPQLGVKVRSRLFDDWLILAASVTNNTSTVEQFDFYREIDRNVAKTLNGRAALRVPLGGLEELEGDYLELGLSGEWGAQDDDTRSDREIWFAGADLQYQSTNFAVKGQVMMGEAPGTPDEEVWALDLSPSGYLELDWQVHARFGFLLRAGLRDAFVNLGTERAYVTNQARFTGGLRWLFNPHIIAKAEYFHNRELGDVEQFGNDMLTSSLLLIY